MLGFVGKDWTAEETGRLEEAMMEVVLGFEGMKVVKSLDAEGEEWKGRGSALGLVLGLALRGNDLYVMVRGGLRVVLEESVSLASF
jgi:hypothetical protein